MHFESGDEYRVVLLLADGRLGGEGSFRVTNVGMANPPYVSIHGTLDVGALGSSYELNGVYLEGEAKVVDPVSRVSLGSGMDGALSLSDVDNSSLDLYLLEYDPVNGFTGYAKNMETQQAFYIIFDKMES